MALEEHTITSNGERMSVILDADWKLLKPSLFGSVARFRLQSTPRMICIGVRECIESPYRYETELLNGYDDPVMVRGRFETLQEALDCVEKYAHEATR